MSPKRKTIKKLVFPIVQISDFFEKNNKKTKKYIRSEMKKNENEKKNSENRLTCRTHGAKIPQKNSTSHFRNWIINGNFLGPFFIM